MNIIPAFALSAMFLVSAWTAPDPAQWPQEATSHPLFVTSDRCVACHNGLVTEAGEDISIGPEWRSGMMANSARDPYWHAAVRREVLDHPKAQSAIENECSTCHMPMMGFQEKAAGRKGHVFLHLPAISVNTPASVAAVDGVSCSLCHQVRPDGLGSDASFTGGFVVDRQTAPEKREVYGQYDVEPGHRRIMSSSSSFVPTRAAHLESSEFCATCHTLFTHSLNSAGETIATLPEQVPYLEWRHSGYRGTNSCQSCHMPRLESPTAITSVLGQPRSGFVRHNFQGGNFFMLRTLNAFREDLGVQARPQELDHAASRTIEHLQKSSARVALEEAKVSGDRLQAAVRIESLAGHKLPTAYPSRRVWLHVSLRDRDGKLVFDSGAITPEGIIKGNDNDSDANRYEPHYEKIDDPDQVQIYEAVMVGADGRVTTGLLTGVRYVKENRIPPRGFDKQSSPPDVMVHGSAATDPNFTGGEDVVEYAIPLRQAPGPYRLQAELWYQPVGYRWAQNLGQTESAETKRFVGYYKKMAPASAVLLASTSAEVR